MCMPLYLVVRLLEVQGLFRLAMFHFWTSHRCEVALEKQLSIYSCVDVLVLT